MKKIFIISTFGIALLGGMAFVSNAQTTPTQSSVIVSSTISVLNSFTQQLASISDDYTRDQMWLSDTEGQLVSLTSQLQDLGTMPVVTDSDRQIVSQKLQSVSSDLATVQTQLQVVLERRRQEGIVLGQIMEKLRLLTILLSQ